MNDGPVLSDDAIRELLEKRAGRAEIDERLAAVRSAAASTPQRGVGGVRQGLGRGWAAGAAGLASAGILVLALALTFGWRLPSAGTASGPSGSTSMEPSAGPPATPLVPGAAEPVLPLTVDQLNALVAANPQALSGWQLVITGTIGHPTPVPSCVGPLTICEEVVVLRGSQPVLTVEPVGNAITRFRFLLQTGLSGPFAAHLINGRTLQYEGPVAVGVDGAPVLPSQLPDPGNEGLNSGYHLVRGWIAGIADVSPCPLLRYAPLPGPQYGCGRQAILSDTKYQPVTSNSFVMPSTGILVQNDAYQDFAPDPTIEDSSSGSGPRLTQPEEATFLVRVAPSQTASCPLASPCPVIDLWAIQARVDQWPGTQPVATVSPNPESSGPPNGATPAVAPLSVAQLNMFMAMNSQSPEGRQLVITGTIASTPPSPGSPAGTVCRYAGGSWTCPPAYLVGSNPRLSVEPIGAIAPGPWPPGGSQILNGTFAATLNGYTLEYQGPVATTASGDAWLPGQLPSPSGSGVVGSYWLVRGWITSPPIVPACAPQPTPYPGPQYTCGAQTTLSDSAFDAETYVAAGDLPHTVRIQNGAYAQFAPEPANTAGEIPEEATFLLQAVAVPACGPTQDCAIPPANDHWAIVARIGPWPVPDLNPPVVP